MPSPKKKLPELYGHTFPNMLTGRSSFINTSLTAGLGFGNTSPLKIDGIIIDDYEIFSFEGQLLFFNMDVSYQQRFTPWLALQVYFITSGRVGTDMSTIMADGVNTLSGGSIGWLIRVLHNDRLNLSAHVNLNNLNGNFINVTEYFDDLINNVPDPKITRSVPAMTMSTGLSGAYAFSPSFGLHFHAEYAFGESFERKKNQGYHIAGVSGDVDFNPRYGVPVGLAVSYSMSSEPEIVFSDGGLSNLAGLRIGYTGSNDFELGLQYTVYNVKILSVSDTPFVGKVMLLMKFYF
jgi:hypothetical protein